MNKERILELADIVEHSETFSMTVYAHQCGSPACIAGHAVVRWPEGDPVSFFNPVLCKAQQILGLDYIRALQLFIPWHGDLPDPQMTSMDSDDITGAQAADTLRRLAETGVVEWRL